MVTPQLEGTIRGFFQDRRPDVLAVYLFGSRARGNSHSHSDIDIAVLLAKSPGSTLDGLCLDLEADLERYLETEVDLLVLNNAPVDLIHRVLRDDRLLLDRDPSARIRFEVKVRNEYFDIEPVLKLYRRGKRKY